MCEGERVGGYSKSGGGREGGRMYIEWDKERGCEDIVRAGEGGMVGDIVRAGEGLRVGDIVRAGEGGIVGGYSESGRGRDSGRI